MKECDNWVAQAAIDPAAQAYLAGYRIGECAKETGGKVVAPGIPEALTVVEVDQTTFESVEMAFMDGYLSGYFGNTMLTPVQAMIAYD